MSFALAIAAVLALTYFFVRARGKKASSEVARDTTPALDAWIAEALEVELAEGALGMRASTPEERKKLARSLRGDPDADVVSAIEEKVKSVELEFVRYSHEKDAEITVRVRYEDGNTGTATKRLAASDLPEAVRSDFERKGGSRVFRTWVFPWARARAL
ncbi:MAG: hypothetical protein KF819_13150 [Labilithrix sp.]|nr:hypothetical protein [Labilithrix sp.]